MATGGSGSTSRGTVPTVSVALGTIRENAEGLYRIRDTVGEDQGESVQLLRIPGN